VRVDQARAAARRWVLEEATKLPGFHGAFSAGSSNWLGDDAVLPATSDLDVTVVFADSAPPANPGKFLYRGVLLDVAYLPRAWLQSPGSILGDYRLAGSLATASILADPTGGLAAIQAAVSREYARRRWVERRCEHAKANVLRHLRSYDPSAALHDQVTAWLFAAGVTTHVLLVAGLRNPTVRLRYLAARELLADHGRLDFHETLLEALGCARLDQVRVGQHLAALAEAFDAAKAVIRTPFFFASDISDVARPIAIDGSRDLVERGQHREAVFWMVATYSRCRQVLHHDAPAATQARFGPGYRRLLDDLGVTSPADLRRRGEQVRALLPRVWGMAEAIMAAHPGIDGR
jgi:hypothetical protein